MLHQELTSKIIGAYYNVYNGTSRDYPEWIYERALMEELRGLGIHGRRQEEYKVYYKERLVGIQQLDMFLAGEVVVELKVAPRLTGLHRAQAISYLKVVGKEVGLLFNFGGRQPELARLHFREATNAPPAAPSPPADWPDMLLKPELSYDIIGGLYEVHRLLGPGFIHRIYANACHHELRLRDLSVHPHKEYHVFYRGRSVGELKFNHLQVGDDLMLFPVALQEIERINVHNLKEWMKHQQVPLGILANFWASSLEIKVLRG
jgi:GxxExxY protein